MPIDPYLTAFRRLFLATSTLLLLGLSAPQLASAQDNPAWQKDDSAAPAETSNPDNADEATAQAPEDAAQSLSYEALSAQAAEAYRAGDYAGASALFRRAYALKPVPNLLYNIGRAEEKSGNFADAVEHYEKFATQPGVNIKSREEALARMRVLREVLELNAPAKPEGSGEAAAESPPSAVTSAQPVPAQPLPAQPVPTTRIERDYSAAWITLSVAAAAYITSGAFAWQARQAHADFDQASSRQDLREAADWGKTSSIIADSALGAGTILTALGVFFVISPTERQVTDGARSARVTPQLGPGQIGLDWAMRF